MCTLVAIFCAFPVTKNYAVVIAIYIHGTGLHIQDTFYGIVFDNHKQEIFLARLSDFPDISVDGIY